MVGKQILQSKYTWPHVVYNQYRSFTSGPVTQLAIEKQYCVFVLNKGGKDNTLMYQCSKETEEEIERDRKKERERD